MLEKQPRPFASDLSFQKVRSAYETARDVLLERRGATGHWTGRLSDSALSTATAVSALSIYWKTRTERNATIPADFADIPLRIKAGTDWLIAGQNQDGGWGDTPESPSNPSTTLLVKCAILLSKTVEGANFEEEESFPLRKAQPMLRSPHHDSIISGWSMDVLTRADLYIRRSGGIEGIQERYGNDKTFSIPILTNAALAGLVPWRDVPPLPFELAWFPQSLFRLLRLPVVSYAIPALVAIGQVIFRHNPPKLFLLKKIRQFVRQPTLEKVRNMQPESGGFLEATPLTAFVVMSLAACDLTDHPVVENGLRFLFDSYREGGSWPIDTNLACWVSTLSVNALAANAQSGKRNGAMSETRDVDSAATAPVPFGEPEHAVLSDERLLDWILSCQRRERHPFTGAVPGGWAWTNLSGGVPDCDDTSGALLALAAFVRAGQRKPDKGEKDARIRKQAVEGIRWLLGLQNRDGGWPTFCRGWNRFPFDRSSVDLTAHVLRAFFAWQPLLPEPDRLVKKMEAAIRRATGFLLASQQADGTWVPLWFGNQYHPREENPFYGTAKVLRAFELLRKERKGDDPRIFEAILAGLRFAAANRNEDGGWGCSSQVLQQETVPIRKGSSRSKLRAHVHFHPQTHSSIEETALLIDAMIPYLNDSKLLEELPDVVAVFEKGVDWLIGQVEKGRLDKSSPIGLYFTKLWYDEKLYPTLFTVSALGRIVAALNVAQE